MVEILKGGSVLMSRAADLGVLGFGDAGSGLCLKDSGVLCFEGLGFRV